MDTSTMDRADLLAQMTKLNLAFILLCENGSKEQMLMLDNMAIIGDIVGVLADETK